MKREFYKACFLLSLVWTIQSITLSNAFAQNNFTPCYIVTAEGDSVDGFVKYRDWVQSPREIEFKSKNTAAGSFLATVVREFGIYQDHSVYRSRKIGLINLTSKQEYLQAPLLLATDSAQVFLKLLVYGKAASLYLYLDGEELPHYFLEYAGTLTELLKFSYRKSIDNRTYLLQVDKYKEQLKQLATTSNGFTDSLPPYQEKFLKRYIKNYNNSFPNPGIIYQSENEGCLFDIDLNVGIENWTETRIVMQNAMTYGIGTRVSFPGKFYNRFVRVNFFCHSSCIGGLRSSFIKTDQSKNIRSRSRELHWRRPFPAIYCTSLQRCTWRPPF